VETICAAVRYVCPKCSQQVDIAATSYFVLYGTFSLIFLWCGFQLVDWNFMNWNILNDLKLSLLGLVVGAPGFLLLLMLFKAAKKRRKHPRVL
jgi:hypothetical protein